MQYPSLDEEVSGLSTQVLLASTAERCPSLALYNEELARLTVQNLKTHEEASQQLEVFREDLASINANVIRTVEDTHIAEQKVASFSNDINVA